MTSPCQTAPIRRSEAVVSWRAATALAARIERQDLGLDGRAPLELLCRGIEDLAAPALVMQLRAAGERVLFRSSACFGIPALAHHDSVAEMLDPIRTARIEYTLFTDRLRDRRRSSHIMALTGLGYVLVQGQVVAPSDWEGRLLAVYTFTPLREGTFQPEPGRP